MKAPALFWPEENDHGDRIEVVEHYVQNDEEYGEASGEHNLYAATAHVRKLVDRGDSGVLLDVGGVTISSDAGVRAGNLELTAPDEHGKFLDAPGMVVRQRDGNPSTEVENLYVAASPPYTGPYGLSEPGLNFERATTLGDIQCLAYGRLMHIPYEWSGGAWAPRPDSYFRFGGSNDKQVTCDGK